MAPDFFVHEVLKEGGLNGNEIENLKYGSEELKEAKKKAEDRVLASLFLYGANRKKFGAALNYLENKYVDAPDDQKGSAFKNTPQEARKFLSNWRAPREWDMPREARAQYYSQRAAMEDAQGKVNEETKTGCAHCGNPKGDEHYTRDCEHLSEDDKEELDGIVQLAAKRLNNGGQGETKSSPDLKATHVQTLRQTIDESGLTKRQVASAERAYKYAERTGHKSQ